MRLLGRLRSSTPEPAFSNVLTPGRIPEFCIPPRLPVPCVPESPLPAAALPWRCAAEPDLWLRTPTDCDDNDFDHTGRTDWDPRSQAALSLPHLPRARTAYGFCALLESPHTRRKESLFLGHPGVPRPGLRHRAHTYAGPRRASDPARPAPTDMNTTSPPTSVPRVKEESKEPLSRKRQAINLDQVATQVRLGKWQPVKSRAKDERENVHVEARKTTSAPSTMSDERRCLNVGHECH
uniref:C2 calcium-dependent domain-containing protein 4B n=1 Tax=Myodes glareolus TaxID=447135 RepID=UPI0020220613|nr:C2 calcium-dependent domain-containing protein 4B [Myodes glareolus]